MFQRLSTNTLNWIILIGLFLLIIEAAFFHGGLVFSVLFSSLLLYIGRKKSHHLVGKVLFGIGAVTLAFTILNMIAFRFFIIAGIVLFFINYSRSKKEPKKVSPQFFSSEAEKENDSLIKIEPLFQQRIFGDQKTSDTAYGWRDVNIHGGFGDRLIDLSNTVLPDQAVISIRHFVGNIKIDVPYEVEVCILHSAVFGRANILGEHHLKLVNQSISYQTENYLNEKPCVKIITSIFSGDIEVTRI
jgi:lia operon protein LiaF